MKKRGKSFSSGETGACPTAKKRKTDGRTLFVRIVAFAVALLMIGSVVLAALTM